MKASHIIAQRCCVSLVLAMALAAAPDALAATAKGDFAQSTTPAEKGSAESTSPAQKRFAESAASAQNRFAASTVSAQRRFAASTASAEKRFGGVSTAPATGKLAAPSTTSTGGNFAASAAPAGGKLAAPSTTPTGGNFARLDDASADGNFYQLNYISDGFTLSGFPPPLRTDPNLVNSWGLAFNPFGPAWVANNGAGVATLYDGLGNARPLVVQIPSPGNDAGGGNPTGIVYNGSPSDFVVSKGAASGPSRFIFATEDGVIAGWAPNVDQTHAIRVIDNSTSAGAVYKGLAISTGGRGGLLYATDFLNRKIDVFDSSFKPVTLPEGAFADPAVPSIGAPFGIQAINGNIYVTYAKQAPSLRDDEKGEGLGLINVFDPNGILLRRFVAVESVSRQNLNAPWGMALAPAGFGKFSNRLLVGNFGDGRINAFDLATGEFVGRLESASGTPIQIDGLWGLAFGNGFENQPVNTLFFTAGPGDEQHGAFGRLDVQ
jgi:uncharacterized protein (TIGR03118 family)